MTQSAPDHAPQALLLVAPGCPHCGALIQLLAEHLKAARLARLELVNVAAAPETAADLGVRSVPWLRLGEMEFEGAMDPAELRRWIELAGTPEGAARYLRMVLESGRLDRARRLVEADPQARLPLLLDLLGDPEEVPVSVRLGAMALLEERISDLAGGPHLGRLREMARSPLPQVRSDACYLLGLMRDPELRPLLESCAADPDAEVAEIGREALGELAAAPDPPPGSGDRD